jgi:hypothetical protein
MNPLDVPVFRKTFTILIEAESYEDAQENFRAEVGGAVGSKACKVVFEEIYGFPGDHQPVRESDRGLPFYPAKATLAAVTGSRSQADAAFASLLGSVTFVPGDPELYFEAMDSGAAERGTMPGPPWP